ncbi:hypothetical protein HYQ45_012134 [Verticillium longisporum]|uniref:Uncharacterized protein n=1 Tax=Verticillium longisporum TaxID=100787 RepID=A0A8I2ZF00_VERLO|nr:hypothetical protein HYQ45_012134 [Verticillium longisporum]
MLVGTELEVSIGADLVSPPAAGMDVAEEESLRSRASMSVDADVDVRRWKPRRKRMGISHLYPELCGSSLESTASATSSWSRIATLYREPVYDFGDDESAEEDDNFYGDMASRDVDSDEGNGEHDYYSPSLRRVVSSGTIVGDDAGDEQVLPLASAVVKRANIVEITHGIPRLVRQNATLGQEIPVTVGHPTRGRVVCIENRKVGPESDGEPQVETDERERSGREHRDVEREHDMTRSDSWWFDEEDTMAVPAEGVSNVIIMVTPATPLGQSAWDSSSSDEESVGSTWIEDAAETHIEDSSVNARREAERYPEQGQSTTVSPRTSQHEGRNLSVHAQSHGPASHAAPLSPASPVAPPFSSLREESIALLLQTFSLPPSTSFTTLQSHLARNTSLLHALLLGTVPAPFLPGREMNDSGSTATMDICIARERFTSASIPALTAFLSVDWDPAALGGGTLALVASAFREAIDRASAGAGRIALVRCAAELRKTSRAAMRAAGRLDDRLLVRLGRVVGLEEVAACADLGDVIRAGRAEEFVGLVEEGSVTRGEGGELARRGAVMELMGIREAEHA